MENALRNRMVIWTVIGLITAAAGVWALGFHSVRSGAPGAEAYFPEQNRVDVVDEETPGAAWSAALEEAIQWGWVRAEFSGNGRDSLKASLVALTDEEIQIVFQEGLLFETPLGSSQVVLGRRKTVDLTPGSRMTVELESAATTSANELENTSYLLTSSRIEALQPLFRRAHDRPDLPVTVLQTAVLAVTENLPLGAFAQFDLIGGTLPTRMNTDPFRVPVRDIVRALLLLEQSGYPLDRLALSIDPQLKIEAMIDPMTYAYALRLYRIQPQEEWAYWKQELLQGDLRTRHYALYGIARYFPEVALQMLPEWARNTTLQRLYRKSAIYALGETGRGEALTVLNKLAYEFRADPELVEATELAKRHLDRTVRGLPVRELPVEFQLSQTLP